MDAGSEPPAPAAAEADIWKDVLSKFKRSDGGPDQAEPTLLVLGESGSGKWELLRGLRSRDNAALSEKSPGLPLAYTFVDLEAEGGAASESVRVNAWCMSDERYAGTFVPRSCYGVRATESAADKEPASEGAGGGGGGGEGEGEAEEDDDEEEEGDDEQTDEAAKAALAAAEAAQRKADDAAEELLASRLLATAAVICLDLSKPWRALEQLTHWTAVLQKLCGALGMRVAECSGKDALQVNIREDLCWLLKRAPFRNPSC